MMDYVKCLIPMEEKRSIHKWTEAQQKEKLKNLIPEHTRCHQSKL
jgi:serine protease inhibitor